MDDNLTQILVTVLGAGGGATVMVSVVNGIFKMITGRTERERRENSDMLTEKDNALLYAEKEVRRRREAEEYISILRRQLHEAGVIPKERNND